MLGETGIDCISSKDSGLLNDSNDDVLCLGRCAIFANTGALDKGYELSFSFIFFFLDVLLF